MSPSQIPTVGFIVLSVVGLGRGVNDTQTFLDPFAVRQPAANPFPNGS